MEHDVPGAPEKSCSPAQVVTAHTESKTFSNFVHMVISGVLFDQETEDCLKAVTTFFERLEKLKHIFRMCLSAASNLVANPGHAGNGSQWQTNSTWGPLEVKTSW